MSEPPEQLPARLQALLDEARTADEPAPEDRRRVHAALMASIGAAPPPASTAGNSSAAPPGPWAGLASGAGLKLAAGLAVLGGLAAAVMWAPQAEPGGPPTGTALASEPHAATRDRMAPTPAARPAQPQGGLAQAMGPDGTPAGDGENHQAVGGAPATGENVPADDRTQAAAPHLQADPQDHKLDHQQNHKQDHKQDHKLDNKLDNKAAVGTRTHGPHKAHATDRRTTTTDHSHRGTRLAHPAAPQASPAPPTASNRAATDPGLGRELTLIRIATAAVHRGQHGRALQALRDHARDFPSGALTQEREGLRVLALCGSDRLEAGRRARGLFLERHPHSPLAARVRNACGGDRE
ncbi:MAG: hypothetical protein OEZ06_16630 [Myxococcales bacterium]|nr:hypothetical protein [Myxococcales bacterium]